jgi:hypothetical protein
MFKSILVAGVFGLCITFGLAAWPAEPVKAPFVRSPTLAALPDNTALDLGKYESNPLKPDGETHSIRIADYSRFTYDSSHHQMLLFGGGHASTPRTDVDVLDFTTLSWQSAYAPTPVRELRQTNRDPERGCWKSTGHPIARHTYDALPFAPSSGELILMHWVNAKAYFTEGDDYILRKVKIAHYDPVKTTWRYSQADTGGFEECIACEYDPESKLIVGLDRGALWTYDPVTQTKTKRRSTSGLPLGYDNNLVYFPPNKKMYLINRRSEVFEVTLDRDRWESCTLVLLSDVTGQKPTGGDTDDTGFACDTVNQIIGGAVAKGRFFAFDPLHRTWTSRVMEAQPPGTAVGSVACHCLDYDPVDGVFIFLSSHGSGGRTWAYCYGRGPKKE